MSAVRARAARILAEQLAGRGSLDGHLADAGTEGPLLRELCSGVCRWHPQLRFILDGLLRAPLRARDRDLDALLLTGLHQLREMDIAEHAAVNETVAAARDLDKDWARPLVNGVLRSYLRRRGEFERRIADGPAAVRLAHPPWLAERVMRAWPGHGEAMLAAGNRRPPMTLRVNRRRGGRTEALERLRRAGVGARAGETAPSAILLERPRPVDELPGFAEGLLSVQDEAAQLAPGLLALEDGQRVLDACAAPGGKTGHLLESARIALTALDRSAGRLRMVRENLDRLGLEAELRAADAAAPAQWWDGAPFDRILLDAPCSATGVIRRHPDVKLLLAPAAVDRLRARQRRLLEALWPCLKPGGLLLYATCSVLPEENDEVVAAFADAARGAGREEIRAGWGVQCARGRQLLPGGGPDGFYYSLLRKDRAP